MLNYGDIENLHEQYENHHENLTTQSTAKQLKNLTEAFEKLEDLYKKEHNLRLQIVKDKLELKELKEITRLRKIKEYLEMCLGQAMTEEDIDKLVNSLL